jgi:hypothetical protein
MATYADFLPEVRIEVSDAPKQVMLTAIVWACRELCNQSLVWRHMSDSTLLFEGAEEMDIDDIPAHSEISRLIACTVDGQKLVLGRDASVSLDGLTVQLAAPTSRQCTGQVTVALRPTRQAAELPDWIVSNYSDTVAHGALYRLQTNPTKTWGNPQSASFHYAQFCSGVARAKIDTVRSGRQTATLSVRPVRFV